MYIILIMLCRTFMTTRRVSCASARKNWKQLPVLFSFFVVLSPYLYTRSDCKPIPVKSVRFQKAFSDSGRSSFNTAYHNTDDYLSFRRSLKSLVHLNLERNHDKSKYPVHLMLDFEGAAETTLFENLELVSVCSIDAALNVTSALGKTAFRDRYDCSTFVNNNYSAVITFQKQSFEGVVMINGILTHFHGVASKQRSKTIVVTADRIDETSKFNCGLDALEPSEPSLVDKRENNQNEITLGRILIERWNNCFPGDENSNKFYIGIAIGSTLAKRLGDETDVLLWVEGIVAQTNMIFYKQLNIYLVVRHVVISADASSENEASWNNAHCDLSIFDQFNRFRDSVKPSQQGLWHIFDDCYRSGDPVGAAYTSELCDPNQRFSIGITYYNNAGTWLTFAHEIGHNHGASHSFEEGKGKTGGIMDYGDKTLNGEYKFNTKYRKDQVCQYISSTMARCTPFREPVLSEATCGNGKLDIGEECDCPMSDQRSCECCEDCKLKPEAVCSPLDDDCCSDSCQYKVTSAENTCVFRTGSLGYCSNGNCIDNVCSRYNLGPFCGIWETNPCKLKCKYGSQDSCQSMDGWTVNGKPLNNVLVGSSCMTNDGHNGYCDEGICVPKNVTTGTPTSSPTSLPTKSPAGYLIISRSPSTSPTDSFIPPPNGRACGSFMSNDTCTQWSGCIWLEEFGRCKPKAWMPPSGTCATQKRKQSCINYLLCEWSETLSKPTGVCHHRDDISQELLKETTLGFTSPTRVPISVRRTIQETGMKTRSLIIHSLLSFFLIPVLLICFFGWGVCAFTSATRKTKTKSSEIYKEDIWKESPCTP